MIPDLLCFMPDQMTFDDDSSKADLQKMWSAALAVLEAKVPATSVEKFLRRLEPKGCDGKILILEAPSRFVQEWVREKHSDIIGAEMSRRIGRKVKVEITAKVDGRSRSRRAEVVAPPKFQTARSSAFSPNPVYTFDAFVEGQSNRLAIAGCKATVSDPGAKYNPLFIYGASGLGKTHLLHAIANSLAAGDPTKAIAYVSAQQFTEEFVHALKTGRLESFRRQHRNVDIWLVDDIQFIAGKDRTIEEFFHTYNMLHGTGRQIVFCSDRPPRELTMDHDRMRTRMEAGLMVEVRPPDTELRCAILLKKAEQQGVNLSHEHAMILAESISGNVRMLEGALTKLAATASLDGGEITRDQALQVADTYFHSSVAARPSMATILDVVSRHTGISVNDIKSKNRRAPLASARHMSIYLARTILNNSWKQIATDLGGFDHTSMIHGHRKIKRQMDQDRTLAREVGALIREISPETVSENDL